MPNPAPNCEINGASPRQVSAGAPGQPLLHSWAAVALFMWLRGKLKTTHISQGCGICCSSRTTALGKAHSRVGRTTVLSVHWAPWEVTPEGVSWCFQAVQFSSVQFSRSVVSDSLRPHEPQHTRPPCPSPAPGVYSNSCLLSQWSRLTISPSVVPFSSRLQFFSSIRVFSSESTLRVR